MKVLILSVPAGGGHYQTAKALYSYLDKQKNTECKILDIAENVSETAATMMSKGYLFASTHMPTGYRYVYNKMDKRTKHSFTTGAHMLYQICGKKLADFVDEFEPDVIISTHVFATVVLNIHEKKQKLNAKIISIVTDMTIHPMWEQTTSDYYITASENLTSEALKKLGETENVIPFGIPIREEFAEKTDKAEAKSALGLEDKFTVLIMTGSMGYAGAALDLVKKADALEDDIQIIAVCGNNKQLKEKLDTYQSKNKLLVFGFCDHIPLLMDACDCIVTKPGGLSTSEAMAKELPIILTNPIPGQEERNLEFMQSNGVAISLSDEFTIDKAINKLIHNPEVKDTLVGNIKKLAKPYSTQNLVEFLHKIIK